MDRAELAQLGLAPVEKADDIPEKYRGTPIGELLQYHDLQAHFHTSVHAGRLLIGMCMDNRNTLRLPRDFAFILRAPGANLHGEEFAVSYAIGVGGASAIALIGHSQCGMSGVLDRKEPFIEGMVQRAGWSRERAEEYYLRSAPAHEIGGAIEFTRREAERLRAHFPKMLVAPLIYRVEDNRLYVVRD